MNRWRRRGAGFDRVGGHRLTGVGALLLAAVAVVLIRPPGNSDPEVLAVVWAALLGVLLVGVVWPLVAIGGIAVAVSSPRDATVGDLVDLRVTAAGRGARCEVRCLDPTGPWHHVAVPGEGVVPHLADRRGRFDQLRVEVRVTAPVGVLAAHRVHQLGLAMPVDVAPRPLAVNWIPAAAPVAGTGEAPSSNLGGDLVRSVRPYVPGDPAHLVHWPSSARVGSLVVREMEPPTPVGQAVVVDLRGLGPEVERAASYALGACRAVLALGGELVLSTCEPGGPVTAPARSVRDAGRRLARAVPGPPGTPPTGWPVVEIGE